MACSRFEYVKNFELCDKVLPGTFMVVRIDGRGFTKFTDLHKFEKPNDLKALEVMNEAAKFVMQGFNELILAYGQSDEYSFLFVKEAECFERRTQKIVSTVVSMFTASYVANFAKITGKELLQLPSFDGRLVCYPSEAIIKDYFSWRQADCHINNLYNVVFWALAGKTSRFQAEERLKKTLAEQKNEILYQEFGINYAHTPEITRKGSVLQRVWKADPEKIEKYEQLKKDKPELKISPPREKLQIAVTHADLFSQAFWDGLYKDFENKTTTNKEE